MKKLLLTLLVSMCICGVASAAKTTDGVVYKDKHVRFTVVTDGLVRLEYSPEGKFVDDKSFVAVERKYPKLQKKAKVKKKDGYITVSTPKMTVRYRKDSGKFTAENLTIESAGELKPFSWHPGMKQQENLMGTTRTLDRWDGDWYVPKGNKKPYQAKIDEGLLARDGWTLIDDSRNFLFDNDPEWDWVKEREADPDAQDWYFMAYGDDYKTALKDYTILAGDISLPPRFVFGYWWSRYWAYSDHEYRQLLKAFDEYQIPVEVLVVDMDWHYTDPAHGGWTGWTWNEWLFPDHKKFLNYLSSKDLKITLNLHPAVGVKNFEAAYPEIARENGIDPASGDVVPWVSSDKRFIKSMFKHILDPMTDNGVNFWWLDWQQHPFDTKIDSLSNTWWINYVFFSKMQKDRPERPLLYHRWGGLGNHRYQIGFSGDTYATWKTLDYLPYFTSTASNVCYGFWSHDIGGHLVPNGVDTFDPELYVRFMQFGTYSPVLRTHSTKTAVLKKEPWRFDHPTLAALRASIQERYKLVPYIYTMARESHDTGVSMIRPMYYDYPTAEEAYTYKNQYMFGDNLLVRPVTAPGVDGYSEIEVWLPEGQWYEKATGTMLYGGRVYKRSFALDEVPVYVKAGAIVPVHARNETSLRSNNAPIAFEVYPGGNGEFTLYEDFGDDQAYEKEFATTLVTSERAGNQLTVTINPRKGKYREMPESRRFAVKVPATVQPAEVKVDGEPSYFYYDPERLEVAVNLPVKNCSSKREVEIFFPEDADVVDGTIGKMKRFVNAFDGIKERYAGLCVTEDFGRMATIYEAVEYDPAMTRDLLNDFNKRYERLESIVADQGMPAEVSEWFMKEIGYK